MTSSVEGALHRPRRLRSAKASRRPRTSVAFGCSATIGPPSADRRRRSARRRAPRRLDTGRHSDPAPRRAAANGTRRGPARRRAAPPRTARRRRGSGSGRLPRTARRPAARPRSTRTGRRRARRRRAARPARRRPVRRRFDLDDVPSFTRRHARPSPLSDRERERASCSAEHGAGGVDDLAPARTRWGRLRPHVRARVAGGREAELLRVRLRRDGQTEPLGERARLGLRELADREQRPGERAWPSMWSM